MHHTVEVAVKINGCSGHIGPDRIIQVPLGTVVRLLPPRDKEDEEEDERMGDGNGE